MKIEAVEKLTDYKHLNMYAVRYYDRSGRRRTWYVASRNDPPLCAGGCFETADAVVMVALHKASSKLVLIKEFRVPLGGYQYGFPAGLVDDGESVADACARELYEETGLSVVRLIQSSPPVYSSSGMTDESVVIAYLECEGEASNNANSDSEDIHPFLVSAEEALSLCRQPEAMVDVKTWLVLQGFAKTGRVF
ncbi:MAG: NUDIX hydrolase [Desulfobacterales bacterium]|nr:NUDIX hydrolase [Desulfobacterales bacterium]